MTAKKKYVNLYDAEGTLVLTSVQHRVLVRSRQYADKQVNSIRAALRKANANNRRLEKDVQTLKSIVNNANKVLKDDY